MQTRSARMHGSARYRVVERSEYRRGPDTLQVRHVGRVAGGDLLPAEQFVECQHPGLLVTGMPSMISYTVTTPLISTGITT
jgi:hypothetical protein